MEEDTREEVAGFGTAHGWSTDGFSDATRKAHAKAKQQMANPGKPVAVVLQEVVESNPLEYHVVVRFPSN